MNSSKRTTSEMIWPESFILLNTKELRGVARRVNQTKKVHGNQGPRGPEFETSDLNLTKINATNGKKEKKRFARWFYIMNDFDEHTFLDPCSNMFASCVLRACVSRVQYGVHTSRHEKRNG